MEMTIKSLLEGHCRKIPSRWPLHKNMGTEAWMQQFSLEMPQVTLQKPPGDTSLRGGNSHTMPNDPTHTRALRSEGTKSLEPW